ncbi:unnamed protein product [Larinioides sclopetarius]|uniref:Uncharacterized protein n=1 Tax=Larinioides sclopetarius TaxID=280406 RepID=A0AAV1Z838_9ARAC
MFSKRPADLLWSQTECKAGPFYSPLNLQGWDRGIEKRNSEFFGAKEFALFASCPTLRYLKEQEGNLYNPGDSCYKGRPSCCVFKIPDGVKPTNLMEENKSAEQIKWYGPFNESHGKIKNLRLNQSSYSQADRFLEVIPEIVIPENAHFVQPAISVS